MAVNLNDLARVELVDKLAAKVAAKLNALNDTTFKAAKVDGNALKFYTSTDTTGQAAETIDIPAEQFLDQVSTSFVPNFQFSALLYDGASNPNLDGKAVLVLGLKTKSNDGKSESISYSFVDLSRLVDIYTASDTSVIVINYKIKVNISADAGNTLKLKSDGLYAAGVTDTATTTAAGLMSAADKTKVNNLDVELSKKLDSDATAVKATKLETARSLKVSLSSSAAQTFDGSADATNIGVAGTLPVANGGTGKTNLNDVTVGAANKDGAGNVITDTYVTKTAFEETVDNIRRWRKIPIYGYRIDKNEADTDARVEYILDAAGMTPATYDSSTGIIDLGSWKNIWFLNDCKPLMLKSDGTVDYYLDPNDYSKKLDGTASDVANTAYDGNAMVQIPLVWVYRYEDANYQYEIISPEKVDDNFKAYAHTDASGNIKPYYYLGIYWGSIVNSKLRSLSGQTDAVNTASTTFFNSARNNGANWTCITWSHRALITTLMILVEKRTNSDYAEPYKYFHFADAWAKHWFFCEGMMGSNYNCYVKPTPEGNGYSVTSTTGYTFVKRIPYAANGYIKTMALNEYGYFLDTFGGAAFTGYSAFGTWRSTANQVANLHGILTFGIRDNSGLPHISCRLSYV